MSGGITGWNNADIINCYNTGNVSGSYSGGIAGSNDGTVSDCYYLDTVGKGVGYGEDTSVKCTSQDMMRQETFTGFDFNGIWTMEGNADYFYPELQGVPFEFIKSATKLTIKEYPDVLAYYVGDTLITDGLCVQAVFDNGTQANVTADCSFRYDFSQKGKKKVEITYDGLSATYDVIVIGKSAKLCMIDPAEGREDVGFYFKEGAALSECYLWEDDYHVYIEDVDDEGNPYYLEVELKDTQITGYDSTPGEKVLTAKVPVGTQTVDVSFSALVIPEEDFDQYMEWRSICFVYNVCAHDREALTSKQYNYAGKVTGENVDFLVDYICNMGEAFPFDYEEMVPANDLKAWMEKYFVIRSFDLTGSPNYNAENDTYYFLPYGGYGGWGLWYFRAQWDTNEAGDTVVQYRVKNTDPLYKHNTDLVISPDGRIVSVTMMPEQVELVSPPNKTAYIQGDKLDLTGGQIKATYDSQRSETISITTDMVSGYNPNTIGAQTVTVTYGGKSVTFPVTITAKAVTGITWKSKPAKTTYITGQPLDLSGAVITATYTSGSVEDIQVTADMVSGYDPNKTGPQTLTVTYAGKTVTFTVTVEAKTLTGISITKKPDKLTYLEGESFDKAGMVVTASYNNGTSETVTDYQVSGYNSTPGTKTITVSYQGKTASFTVTVAPKSLCSIAITQKPTKLTYIEGEQLNLSGLVVTASYDNGTSGTVTGYQVSGYTSTPGTKTITITYGGKSATFTVTVQAKAVSSISMKANPSKTTYLTGESLNLAGAKITVKYNNNTQKDIAVTTAMVSGYNADKVGSQTVIVTYAGKSTSFKVTVQSRVPSSITSGTYSISGGFISKIGAGTTVSQLLNGINERAYCKVYKGSSEVTGGTLIGTGMTVKLLDGSTVKQTLTIVVTGDTNGDGNITITDMLAVKSHLLKKSTLTGAAAKAADTSGDKAISITDFIQIKAHILGKDKVQARAC